MSPATDQRDARFQSDDDDLDDAQASIGQVVAGTYRLVRYIGSGGSSQVYEAQHVRLAKSFALKRLRPGLAAGGKTAQRFRREAQAIARLRSEHVVSVIDCGELEDRSPYLVMELLDGEDLRSLLSREQQLPLRRALAIALDACRGLVAVHAAGLVHRDLKPENLFITRRCTGEDWCKVLDFGVAKMDSTQSTAEGAIVGTVRYMAPEQLEEGSAVGPATDIYAIGAILYECLAGKALVQGDSVQEAMYRVMNVEAPLLSTLRPELPGAVSQLVARCLAKASSDRPASAAELETAIRAVMTPTLPPGEWTESEETGLASATSSPSISRRRSRRWLTLAPAALVIAGATGWFLRGPLNAASKDLGPSSKAVPTVDEPLLVTKAIASVSPALGAAPPSSSLLLSPGSASPAPPPVVAKRRLPEGNASPRSSAATPPRRHLGPFDAANPY